MWTYGANDGSGEYLSDESVTLAEALDGMTRLKRFRPARYVWAASDYCHIIARLVGADVRFVVAPLFADLGDHDPPEDALPFSTEEFVALDEAGAVLVPHASTCERCGSANGYLANRIATQASLYVCLNCANWQALRAPIPQPGLPLRRSPLSD
jgi:hypothetical protein